MTSWKLCKRLTVCKSLKLILWYPEDLRLLTIGIIYAACNPEDGNKGIITDCFEVPNPSHALACSPNVRCSPIPPQTWWLLNLFLVSFDKLPCLHRDIPLTQPLVIVYTGSRQSWRALSGFDSNIHFASEVPYRKWLDRSSLFLQLLPPFLPHSVSAHTNIIWDWRHDSALGKSTTNIYLFLIPVWGHVARNIISGNEQYLSVRRIRCFGFVFWTWCTITKAWCPLFHQITHEQ